MQLEPLSKNCDKDDCAGQVTLVSQCDGLTRVMTESQRHIDMALLVSLALNVLSGNRSE